MVKRTAYLHIGPTHTGTEFLDGALAADTEALAAHGVRRPATSPGEMLRAAVEIRRTHKSWGLKRKEVEGTWSGIARRAWKGRDVVVLAEPQLAGATRPEIALLLDALPGFDVHVVLNATAPGAPGTAGHEGIPTVAARWASALRSPDRLHVIVPPPGGGAAAYTWRALGSLVGFAADTLPVVPPLSPIGGAASTATREELVELGETWARTLAEGGYDIRGDLTDLVPSTVPGTADDDASLLLAATAEELAGAREELTRLRVAHAALEARHDSATKKRKKLERRLTGARG